jgi:Ni,Fe-hydrogenase III large subunit
MRLIARFAKEQKEYFEIITVYDVRTIKERINKITPALVSIAQEHPSAVWFERKITDDFGIEILYSNDKRPLVKHEHFPKDIYPMRKAFQKLSLESKSEEVDASDGNHGVILGPTHPYHLESSQFQLFERNSEVLHFETMPFYKYRAIEKMLEGMTLDEAKPIIERISGTSSIAYQLAYLDIQLQASKRILPQGIKREHLFLLELERVINHLNDMAMMCRFIDFLEGSYFFRKLLELAREAMNTLTGHRFGFGAVDLSKTNRKLNKIHEFIDHLEKELLWFEKWMKSKPSFWKALVEQGLISKEDALAFGLVGTVARSTGISLDRREEDRGLYHEYGFISAYENRGDASSRFKIRLIEIHTSLGMMHKVLEPKVLPFFIGTIKDGEYYSYIEGSGGEVMMYMELKDEKINRFFLRDPSFLNAQILSRCLKNSNIDALGLIIKSIPLSFSANDL